MNNWKHLLEQGYADIGQLKEALHLSDRETGELKKIQQQYPMFVNPYYLFLIDPDNDADPIRRLCIPSIEETVNIGSFDTSGEKDNTILPGLQHKYRQTALILSTNRCAMYCRHCFRRRMVGVSEKETLKEMKAIIDYISEHTEISNVLISGGDALMNSNELIREYLEALSTISHLDLIRIGTRMPVVMPQRITSDSELIQILHKYARIKKINIMTQFNHPAEVTEEAVKSIDCLLEIGIPVRNQTVLLRGVNDDSYVLGTLIKKLTTVGVMPYYVLQCRPVTGVMNHFQLPLRQGYEITEGAKQMQSGIGKSFRYVLSHVTGKIEILGPADKISLIDTLTVHPDRTMPQQQDIGRGLNSTDDNLMLFKYHQAKDAENHGRIFAKSINQEQCWLD